MRLNLRSYIDANVIRNKIDTFSIDDEDKVAGKNNTQPVRNREPTFTVDR